MGHVIRELSINAITVDPELQPRIKMDKEHSKKLHDLYLAGLSIAEPDVFEDPESSELRLADGFHRRDAHLAMGKVSMRCRVHPGDRRAAMLFAIKANNEHTGLMLTNKDRQKAAELMLNDPEWRDWPDERIAESCGYTSPTTITAIRERLGIPSPTSWDRKGAEIRARHMAGRLGGDVIQYEIYIKRHDGRGERLVYKSSDKETAELKLKSIQTKQNFDGLRAMARENAVETYLRSKGIILEDSPRHPLFGRHKMYRGRIVAIVKTDGKRIDPVYQVECLAARILLTGWTGCLLHVEDRSRIQPVIIYDEKLINWEGSMRARGQYLEKLEILVRTPNEFVRLCEWQCSNAETI